MKLFIAGKPDLEKDIANALTDGRYVKKNGHFECKNNDRVTWLYGHLLKSVEPEMYNPDYKLWNTADLLLKLFPLRYEPIPDKKSHTDLVISLINQADEIVHTGDPDDEGHLLVDELLIYANNRKPVKRILINDNNINAVKKALNNLKDNRDFYGIYQKTSARSAGD